MLDAGLGRRGLLARSDLARLEFMASSMLARMSGGGWLVASGRSEGGKPRNNGSGSSMMGFGVMSVRVEYSLLLSGFEVCGWNSAKGL